MSIFYRIDNRLIHAQVMEAWLPWLKADTLVVVSDEMAKDEFRQQIAATALPQSVNVHFLSIPQAASKSKEFSWENSKKTVVLFGSPQDMLSFIIMGANKPSEVNIGGLHYAMSKISLGRYRTFSEGDRSALLKLHQMGIRLDARATPTDEPVDMLPLLHEE